LKKILTFKYTNVNVPIIDVTRYLEGKPGW